MAVCLLAQAAACRLDLAMEHLPGRAVGFLRGPVVGCPPDQAVDCQRVLVVGCPRVRVAVSPLDLVAVFLQALAAVSQQGREVECRPAQRHIGATSPLGQSLLRNWKGEGCISMPTSSEPTCHRSDTPNTPTSHPERGGGCGSGYSVRGHSTMPMR